MHASNGRDSAGRRLDCDQRTCASRRKKHRAAELAALGPLVAQGLVKLCDHELEVTKTGWFFVRAIAMVFDRYLQADRNRARFSRIVDDDDAAGTVALIGAALLGGWPAGHEPLRTPHFRPCTCHR